MAVTRVLSSIVSKSFFYCAAIQIKCNLIDWTVNIFRGHAGENTGLLTGNSKDPSAEHVPKGTTVGHLAHERWKLFYLFISRHVECITHSHNSFRGKDSFAFTDDLSQLRKSELREKE